MIRAHAFRLLAWLLPALLAAACGQKGDLRLPAPKPDAQGAAAPAPSPAPPPATAPTK